MDERDFQKRLGDLKSKYKIDEVGGAKKVDPDQSRKKDIAAQIRSLVNSLKEKNSKFLEPIIAEINQSLFEDKGRLETKITLGSHHNTVSLPHEEGEMENGIERSADQAVRAEDGEKIERQRMSNTVDYLEYPEFTKKYGTRFERGVAMYFLESKFSWGSQEISWGVWDYYEICFRIHGNRDGNFSVDIIGGSGEGGSRTLLEEEDKTTRTIGSAVLNLLEHPEFCKIHRVLGGSYDQRV